MNRFLKLSLLFSVASLCLTFLNPSSVSAQTDSPQAETICANTPIPAGWVLTNIRAESFTCGVQQQPNFGPLIYNVWTIENVTNSYVGTRILVCDRSDVPAGWIVIERQAVSYRCGVEQQPGFGPLVINVKVLERVVGPIRPTPTPTPTPTTTPTPNPTPTPIPEPVNFAVPADYDGDDKADLSIKGNDGRWLIDYSLSGFGGWDVIYNGYGGVEAKPVPADYDGDGKADISVKTDDGRWLINYALNGFGGSWDVIFSGY